MKNIKKKITFFEIIKQNIRNLRMLDEAINDKKSLYSHIIISKKK